MSAIAKTAWISPEEYLEGEKLAAVRHEYVSGDIYSMAGASSNHARITGNIHGALLQRLRGSKCEPFATDLKVHIPPVAPTFFEAYYYPDVMVVCDPTDNAEYFRERPTVIFEVISPGTQRIDHSEKGPAYRSIPSLKVYAMVEQSKVFVTVMRRSPSGWAPETITDPNAVLKLPEIGVEIPIVEMYERTGLI